MRRNIGAEAAERCVEPGKRSGDRDEPFPSECSGVRARLARGSAPQGTDIPYLSHLLGVASLVLEGGGSLDLHVPTALLHDVVEDTEAPVEDVRASFGDDVAAIVEACGGATCHCDQPGRLPTSLDPTLLSLLPCAT
jgi:HD domain